VTCSPDFKVTRRKRSLASEPFFLPTAPQTCCRFSYYALTLTSAISLPVFDFPSYAPWHIWKTFDRRNRLEWYV